MSVTMSVMLSQAALADINALPKVDPEHLKEVACRYLANHDPLNSGKPVGRRGGSVVMLCLWANCWVLLEVIDKAKKKFKVHGVAKREVDIRKIARRRRL